MDKPCCKFWLPKKNRFCSNVPLKESSFCGNHKPNSQEHRIPCPIDPSHSILQENLDAHVKRCPLQKQVQALETKAFYKKGINSGKDEELCTGPCSDPLDVTSDMKRNAIYKMKIPEFLALIAKIKSIHRSIFPNMRDSYIIPEACDRWLKKELDQELPYQEKHVLQQASILGNMEVFGILQSSTCITSPEPMEQFFDIDSCGSKIPVPAVVEFGAGRGYLTHMLADCYGIEKVFLVERRSYKLKADRSLRQKQRMNLKRLRIDIEDLNLNAVEPLRGVPYLAVGKHLCGPATDLALRCCLPEQCSLDKFVGLRRNPYLSGLALATCCHHLCQWKSYINKRFFSSLEITKEDFNAITWFTSWAVDASHGSDLFDEVYLGLDLLAVAAQEAGGVEEIVRNMKAVERAMLGFACKEIIDAGRLMWLKEHGLEAEFVKYVSSKISPENHLLIAKYNPLS